MPSVDHQPRYNHSSSSSPLGTASGSSDNNNNNNNGTIYSKAVYSSENADFVHHALVDVMNQPGSMSRFDSFHSDSDLMELDHEQAMIAADSAITASEALAVSGCASTLHSEPSSPLRSHRNSYLFGPNKSFLSSLAEESSNIGHLDDNHAIYETDNDEEEEVVDHEGLDEEMEMDLLPTKRAAPNLHTLPPEVLSLILQDVMLLSPPETASASLARMLPTCFSIYDVGIPVLYRRVSFPKPHTFDKFRRSIERSGYGILVRALDFSAFTSVGLGRTGKMMMEIQMVTASTIFNALEMCPNLHEFSVAESVDMDLDSRIINHLLENTPLLDSIDFTGSTSKPGFIHALEHSIFSFDSYPIQNLTKISFHACSTVSSETFGKIFPKLTNLKRLDLTHTQVTPDALLALPSSATLTHLSLAKCVKLTSHGLLKFLLLHPATRHLEWLNLMFDVTKPSPLSPKDFDTIIHYLPKSNARDMKYLNLSGLPVKEHHIKSLSNLQSLQSLSLGHADIPIDKLSKFLPLLPELKVIDLTGNPYLSLWSIQGSTALFNANPNIDIFEFSADMLNKIKGVSIPGFDVEIGRARRGWIYRKIEPTNQDFTSAIATPSSSSTPSYPQAPISPTTTGFSFANFAQERLRQRSVSPPLGINGPTSTTFQGRYGQYKYHPPPQQSQYLRIEQLPAWAYASRKINMSVINVAGKATDDAVEQRGIYAYYGHHI